MTTFPTLSNSSPTLPALFPSKFIISSSLIFIITRALKYNLLSTFSVAHMYMCLGMTISDFITYKGTMAVDLSLSPSPLIACRSQSRVGVL